MKYHAVVCVFLLVCAFAVGPVTAGPRRGQGEIYAHASDGTPLRWTVFTPPGRGQWPAVLVVHGGLFTEDTYPPDLIGCAEDLAAAGFVVYVVEYRLAPPGSIPGQRSSGRYPDQYDDIGLAVEAARQDSRSNGHVGSVGGSSGATHTAWAAATGTAGADRVDVGVCLSGAYDFTDFRPDPNIELFISTVTNYVGVPRTDIPDLRTASPISRLDQSVSPLFLVDSAADQMPAVQLDDMAAALSAVGAHNFEAMTIPGNGHAFGNWSRVKDDAIAFLSSVLVPERR